MGPFRPHEPICVDSLPETMHFFEVTLRLWFKEDRNAFLPKLETNESQQISNPICLLDDPLTLDGGDGETICFEAR